MKLLLKTLSLGLILSLMFATACKHEPTLDPNNNSNNGNQGNGIPCNPDTVYFYNDILPLINSSCGTTGCHDDQTAEHGIRLINYQTIIDDGDIKPFKPNDGELIEKITETDPSEIMPPPPSAPLTADQIQMIKKWISQGALENACKDTLCDTTNVTFQDVVWPILDLNCKGCHSGIYAGGGIQINNYNEVNIIANNGSLMGSIGHQPNYSPMPKNQSKLDSCSLVQINIWINEGAQNN